MYNTVMQDQEKLREIENLGEEDDDIREGEIWGEDQKERGCWGGVLLVQAVICALIVLALVFFRISDNAKFQEIAAWYEQEMAKEIELPTFSRTTPEPTQPPESTPTPAPPVSASAPLQML